MSTIEITTKIEALKDLEALIEEAKAEAETLRDEIKAEITRLKEEGLNKKLFNAVRSNCYGNAIRNYNSMESIAMDLVDCAMSGHELFDEIKCLKSITVDDVFKRLAVLNNDKTVLSVIVPKEK